MFCFPRIRWQVYTTRERVPWAILYLIKVLFEIISICTLPFCKIQRLRVTAPYEIHYTVQ